MNGIIKLKIELNAYRAQTTFDKCKSYGFSTYD